MTVEFSDTVATCSHVGKYHGGTPARPSPPCCPGPPPGGSAPPQLWSCRSPVARGSARRRAPPEPWPPPQAASRPGSCFNRVDTLMSEPCEGLRELDDGGLQKNFLTSLALAGTDLILPSSSRRDKGSRRDDWQAERQRQQVHNEESRCRRALLMLVLKEDCTPTANKPHVNPR